MRFLLLMWTETNAAGGDQSDIDAWTAFDEKAKAAGVYVDNGALQPAATEARLVRTKLAGHALDGAVDRRPYSAGSTQIEAFYIMECENLETALRWANDLPTYGMVEVRPLIEFA